MIAEQLVFRGGAAASAFGVFVALGYFFKYTPNALATVLGSRFSNNLLL